MRLLLAGALLAGLARAHPHVPPAISLDIEIMDGEVTYVVSGRRDVLANWFSSDAPIEELMRDGPRQEALAAVVELFSRKNPVVIDGTRTRPFGVELARYTDEVGASLEYLKLTLAFTCEGWPRKVRFLWETFEGAWWEDRKQVPVLIDVAGELDTFLFSPSEPEHIWHAKAATKRRLKAVAPIVNPAAPAPPDPFLPLGALAAGGVAALALRRRRLVAAAAFAAGLCGALLLGGLEERDDPARPSPAQARALFEDLHRNIYRAFDAKTEDEIYDLLAVSVDAALLDDLYADVYESLILRSQGGAVARVKEIEVLSGHVEFPEPEMEAGRFFDVDWNWRVHCAVTHWGHTHERTNQYQARYTVRHDGASWKIADVEVTEQMRLLEEEEQRDEALEHRADSR